MSKKNIRKYLPKQRLVEGFLGRQPSFSAKDAKDALLEKLRRDGDNDFADVLEKLDLYVVDVYKGSIVNTAMMVYADKAICINPDFFIFKKVTVVRDKKNEYDKMFDQLSVLVRHEILHYLLDHANKFKQYLLKKYPKDWRWMMSIMTIENGEPVSVIGMQQNIAADFDVSKHYRANTDYEVVKEMTLCNRVIGGLVLELDKPEWLNLSYEELLDKILSTKEELEKKIQKQIDELPEVTIQKKTNSPEYEAIYNKIIVAFNDASDDEISDLMDKVANGEEIRDKKGNIIIGKGE